MSKPIPTFASIEAEYRLLWGSCVIRPERLAKVEEIAGKIARNRKRYEEIGLIPWELVGVIHNMESGLDFGAHLHNGDPLTARTVQVPKDRPPFGKPPFSWEESARDAINMKLQALATASVEAIRDGDIARWLWFLERYNGFGYRQYHPDVLTPYLWSFTDCYESGKYVADGKWNQDAVSKQCGAAAILKVLLSRGT